MKSHINQHPSTIAVFQPRIFVVIAFSFKVIAISAFAIGSWDHLQSHPFSSFFAVGQPSTIVIAIIKPAFTATITVVIISSVIAALRFVAALVRVFGHILDPWLPDWQMRAFADQYLVSSCKYQVVPIFVATDSWQQVFTTIAFITASSFVAVDSEYHLTSCCIAKKTFATKVANSSSSFELHQSHHNLY